MKVWIMCCLNLGSVLSIHKILLDFLHFAKVLNKIFKIAQKRLKLKGRRKDKLPPSLVQASCILPFTPHYYCFLFCIYPNATSVLYTRYSCFVFVVVV